MAERPYARASSIRLIAGAALVIGLVGGIGGVAYAINGATQGGAPVIVPVQVHGDLGVSFGAAPVPAPGLGPGAKLVPASGDLTLRATDSTRVEQFLARGDAAVIGVAVLAGAVLLRGLLLSIADGRPFERGNARRIAGIAGLVLVAGTIGPLLPDIAGIVVLDRLGSAAADGPYRTGVSLPLIPLLCVPVLLALAEAFRRGAELADDVRGLV